MGLSLDAATSQKSLTRDSWLCGPAVDPRSTSMLLQKDLDLVQIVETV